MLPNGREIIREGYRRGLPVAEIARLAQSTRGSVKVIAHNMRLKHPFWVENRIPPDLVDDYRFILKHRYCTKAEAHKMLGVPL